MQSAHMLTLLSTAYDGYFETGARACKPPKTGHAEEVFQLLLGRHVQPQVEEKSKAQLKSEMYERVAAIVPQLFEHIKKYFKKDVNQGYLTLTPGSSGSWPEESAILKDLFSRYLNVTMVDQSAYNRNFEKTNITFRWERSEHKTVAAILGVPVAPKESKTNEFRQNDKFCDCVIVVGDKQFSCHKVILSKKSLYFETLFAGGFKETHESDPIKLDDPTLTPELFETLLEYIYTGSTDQTGKTYSHLILLAEKAKMLMLPKLEFICNRLLVTKINAESWREIATHALSIDDGGILKSHCEYFLKSPSVLEYLQKQIESSTLEEMCDYYELSDGYANEALATRKKALEARIREAISEENFAEVCKLGLSLRSGSTSRKFLEQELKSYAEYHQEWINDESNSKARMLYIKLLTGLVIHR